MADVQIRPLIKFLSDLACTLKQEAVSVFGNDNDNLNGTCIGWTTSPEALEFARQHNRDYILCHEKLFMQVLINYALNLFHKKCKHNRYYLHKLRK